MRASLSFPQFTLLIDDPRLDQNSVKNMEALSWDLKWLVYRAKPSQGPDNPEPRVDAKSNLCRKKVEPIPQVRY